MTDADKEKMIEHAVGVFTYAFSAMAAYYEKAVIVAESQQRAAEKQRSAFHAMAESHEAARKLDVQVADNEKTYAAQRFEQSQHSMQFYEEGQRAAVRSHDAAAESHAAERARHEAELANMLLVTELNRAAGERAILRDELERRRLEAEIDVLVARAASFRDGEKP